MPTQWVLKEMALSTRHSHIFGGDGSVVDAVVDELVFGVCGVEGHLHNVIDAVVPMPVGTIGLRDASNWNLAEVRFYRDKLRHTIYRYIFSMPVGQPDEMRLD